MYSKLTTPFGEMCITIDGKEVEYVVEELYNESEYSDGTGYLFKVDGRYKISPATQCNYNFPLEIECYVNKFPHIKLREKGNEGGEHMVMWSMYSGNTKLSIGGLDEMPDYLPDAVEGYYVPTGVATKIMNRNHLEYAYYYIAWVELTGDDYETNGDIYTWYAADHY